MTWHWRRLASCDLDELLDGLNPQMKDLEGDMQSDRPAIMAGYPRAHGSIVDHASVSHTGNTTETTLKTFDFGRGAITRKGGFRIHAAGTCGGALSSKTINLKWGGETIATIAVAAVDGRAWSLFVDVFNIDTTQEQRYLVHAYDGTTLETMTVASVSVDTL